MKRPLLLAALVVLAGALAFALARFTGAGPAGTIGGPDAAPAARTPGPRQPTPALRAPPEEQPTAHTGPERTAAAPAPPPDEQPAEEAAGVAPELRGALAGHVVYADGVPAPDALLVLTSYETSGSTPDHPPHDEGSQRELTPDYPPRDEGSQRELPLDSAARFRVEGLDPGWYSLWAVTERGVGGLTVTLAHHERALELVVELAPAGAVHGLVLDRAGAPFPDRPVALVFGFEDLPDTSEQVSGPDGRFRFQGVPVGSYTVAVAPPAEESGSDWVFENLWTTPVEVEEGRISEVVVQQPLRGPIRMSGRVLRGGAPVEGTTLFLLREGTSLLGSARFCESAADGTYAMEVPEPGPHTLLVSPDEDELPSLGQTVTVPDADAFEHDVLLPTGGIVGVVRGFDGAPVRAGLNADREDHFLELVIPDEAEQAQTSDDGSFALPSLAPGVYVLRVKPHDGRYARAVRRVVVGEGVERVELVLPAAARVTGRVLAPDGAPVAGAIVHVFDADGRVLSPIGPFASRDDGSFELEHLPPGPLTLVARTDTMTSEESAPLRPDPDAPLEVELRLCTATLIAVRVVDAAGRPTAAGVRALDVRGRDVGAGYCPSATRRLMRHGFDSASQELGPFLPGTYRVEATAPGGRRAARTLELAGEERVELELRLD